MVIALDVRRLERLQKPTQDDTRDAVLRGFGGKERGASFQSAGTMSGITAGFFFQKKLQ